MSSCKKKVKTAEDCPMWTGEKYSSQRGAWHDKKKNGTSKHVSMEFTTKIKTARNWKAGISILG